MINSFLFLSLIFTVYSYGFVDLNLTLTSNPMALKIITFLQQIAYFQRPTSALIFASLFALLFLLYVLIVRKFSQLKNISFPWNRYLAIVLLFALAYPLLSHDVFNYMFHSKIIWKYHQNPHLVPPWDFFGDEWLRFMRWIHTPSAYGPVFTFIISPVYLLGLGKFVPTLFVTKLLNLGFHLFNIVLIEKILKTLKVSKKTIVLAQLLFAFNPYILLDTLANAHNDGVMMSLFFVSLLFFFKSAYLKSFIFWLASVGTKLVTVAALPLVLLKNKLPWQQLFKLTALIFLAPVFFRLDRFQPWYMLWFIYMAFLTLDKRFHIAAVLFSLGAVLYYIPYLYTGVWINTPAYALLTIFSLPALFAAYILIKLLSSKLKKASLSAII